MKRKKIPATRVETKLAQSLHFFDKKSGGIIPSLDLSTTFKRNNQYEAFDKFIYAREGNQTTFEAEKIVQCLDESVDTLLFSSGMSAVTTLLDTLHTGNHIIIQKSIYYAISDYIEQLCSRRGIELSKVCSDELYQVDKYIKKEKTKLIWIETPSNPYWVNIDISKISKITSSLDCKLIVDATCSPGCTTQPLKLGADICFQSTTKYLNGHSDALGGALSTNKKDIFWEKIIASRNYNGSVMNPLNAWLLIRGLKTLFIRFKKSSESAMKLAKHLKSNRNVKEVLYPGIESHPTFSIAKKQMLNGYGGMLSILLYGDIRKVQKTVRHTKVFIPATSLGSVESLIEHRKLVEGPESAVDDRLIRLSVGLENIDDLMMDLDQAIFAN